MKTYSLLTFVVLMLLAVPGAHAEGHAFPGQGEKAKWDEANTVFNQGILFFRGGGPKNAKPDYDKAIVKFKEAIALYPYDYEYFNSLGLAYKKKNDFGPAAEALKQSIELQPSVWENWSNLGSVYKHQGMSKEALEAYTKALSLNPPPKSKQLLWQNVSVLKADIASTVPAK
jgi:tetratricopeptide (TPR) repeat protein